MSLSVLKLQRSGLRGNCTKENTKALDYLKAKQQNIELLQVSADKLQSYKKDLASVNTQIWPLLLEDAKGEELVTTDVNRCAEYDETILDTYQKLTSRIKTLASEHASQASSSNQSTSSNFANSLSIKLPKLSIDKFSGDPLKWQSFWDQFESTIHENNNVSVIDKFKYLISLLDGEPKRLIEGYRITQATYKTAIDKITKRFGDPEIVIFSHLEAILAIPAAGRDNNVSLVKVFDECDLHIRSLISLGLSEDTFGLVFTPILLSKLPAGVRIELHRQNGSNKWTFSRLRELLQGEIDARERGLRYQSKESGPNIKSPGNGAKSGGKNGGFSKQPPTTTSSLMNQTRGGSCIFFGAKHYSDACTVVASLGDRKAKVKGRCFACLTTGHTVSTCKRKKPCFYCGKDHHHRSLCPKQFGSTEGSQNPPNPPPHTGGTGGTGGTSGLNPFAGAFSPGSASKQSSNILADTEAIQLQLATVKVQGTKPGIARLVLDPGSTKSFIQSSFCDKIQAKCIHEHYMAVGGFGDAKRKTRKYQTYEVALILPSGEQRVIEVDKSDHCCCPVVKHPRQDRKHPILSKLLLAEAPSDTEELVEINILLGADYYYEFVKLAEVMTLPDGLTVIGSDFGFILTGKVECPTLGPLKESVVFCDSATSPNVDLEQFWRLEDMGIFNSTDKFDDDRSTQAFNSTIEFKNGRYWVKWPFKDDKPALSDNYFLAMGRLKSLLRRLSLRPDLRSQYHQIIIDQFGKGVVEVAPSHPDGQLQYYVPHHVVEKPERATTKLRVVYDASSKAGKHDLSLNECLLRGPVLLCDLVELLIRFRVHKIAFISDIEKAFLQIMLHPPDRDVVRFLWVKDPTMPVSENNLVILRFCRVPFGCITSPFLLEGVLMHHLQKSSSPVAQSMIQNHYADNIIDGAETVSDAVAYYEESTQLLGQASMRLREWFSNSPEFIDEIRKDDRGTALPVKVLGLFWDLSEDKLFCRNLGILTEATSKRGIMKAVGKVFDPIGLTMPVTVLAKLLVQELWQKKYAWDDPLPVEIVKTWLPIRDNLHRVSEIRLDRRLGDCLIDTQSSQVHVFTDASAKAYGAVVYTLLQNSDTAFVLSKSRLAPLKNKVTIPRLELLGIEMGANLGEFVRQCLAIPSQNLFLWTDSQCALHWILGKKVKTVFVRNRVEKIRSVGDIKFHYVPTEDNPADLITRGIGVDQLQNSKIWLKGPKWLKTVKQWPTCDITEASDDYAEADVEPSVKTESCLTSQDLNRPESSLLDVTKFSSFGKLLRVMVYVIRFTVNCRCATDQRRIGGPVETEVTGAVKFLVGQIQLWAFGCDLRSFHSSSMKELRIFKDADGLLRCRGRIGNAPVPDSMKYPLLLPKNSHVTDLVVSDFHVKLAHAGVNHTLMQLRLQFWIPQGRAQVKRVIGKCRVCRRLSGGPYKVPLAPPLPEFRVTGQNPFHCVGIDYLDPLYTLASDGSEEKAWICLFTSANARYIHLEVVNSLSANQFLLALRRFCALCDKPTIIVSDNAKLFVAGDKVLKRICRDAQEDDHLQQFLSSQYIDWKFTTELAPWMGGFYERMVALVKKGLKAVLQRARVSFVELQTVATEVAAILNSRPLGFVETEPGETLITPNHLVKGQSRTLLPPVQSLTDGSNYEPEDGSRTLEALAVNWKHLQALLNRFWDLWQHQYLLSLRERPGTKRQRDPSVLIPTVGSVVLLGDKGSRQQWQVGRIAELCESSDGQNRSAFVDMPGGKRLKRPLKLLYPLELDVTDESGAPGQLPLSPKTSPRPHRRAALAARKRIRLLNDDATDSETD